MSSDKRKAGTIVLCIVLFILGFIINMAGATMLRNDDTLETIFTGLGSLMIFGSILYGAYTFIRLMIGK